MLLFYAFLCPVILATTPVFSLVQIETKHPASATSSSVPTTSFTNDTVIDVIRNISRVNNALQELIKNYEQLQKIYKAETFESGDDYSTDSEIDERYRDEKHKKKNRAKVTTDAPVVGFPATQFTAFEDSVESSATDDESVEEAKSESSTTEANNRNRLPTIENLYAQSYPSKNEIKPDSTESSVSDEVVTTEKAPIHITSTKKPPQIIFIDTHKLLNNVTKSDHRPQANVEPIRTHERDTSPRPKTRYKKVDHRSDLRSGFQNDISLSINVNSVLNTKGNQNVVHAESLPREKMWDDISKYKPIKIQDDAYFRTKTKQGLGSTARTEKSTLRNEKRDPERPNFNKAARAGYQETKDKESESDSAAEEKEMNKEIFKTHVLRQAYGDSCTKLVVRKCFKACKAAVKRSCYGSACKSSFKESFQNYSKTGCIKQFDTSISQALASDLYRKGGINFPNDESMTAACWALLSAEQSTTRKRILNSTSLRPEEELILLRNRYEKACQSASANKCNTACMYSYQEACKSSECPKAKVNRFKKNCKGECRNVFKRSVSKESDSGSTSSESTSDSSSGSSDSSSS